ncbi:MAG: glycosyltransferase family 4 protein [Flavobacteriales bacterium]
MKILQIIPALASGGAERFVVDLCNEFIEQKYEVVLCTLFDLNEKEEYRFFKNKLSPKVKLCTVHKKLGFDFKMYYKIIKLILKEKPTIVHSHLNVINYLFLAAFFFKFFGKVKFVHTLHNDASKLFSHRYEKIIRKILYQFKLIYPVVISEISKISFEDVYGKFIKTFLIYNGRKQENFSKDFNDCKIYFKKLRRYENTFIFLHIGRFIQQKNQLNLLKAISLLNKENIDVRLLFIGEGFKDLNNPVLENIEMDIREFSNKNSDCIYLLGRKDNVIDYLKLADAFLLPSNYEGMPITVIEAFSMGCIPICSKVGGVKNMIEEGKDGFFFEGQSIQDIVKKLKEFIALDQKCKEEISQNGKIKYQHYFSIEKSADKYIACFKKLSHAN